MLGAYDVLIVSSQENLFMCDIKRSVFQKDAFKVHPFNTLIKPLHKLHIIQYNIRVYAFETAKPLKCLRFRTSFSHPKSNFIFYDFKSKTN